MTVHSLFSFLFPRQAVLSHRERIISGLGGILAILVTSWMTHIFIGPVAAPYLLAAMGASTVLLLGAPHSPFSQPWSFAGGHLVSAAIGITCALYLQNIYLAAGLAVGLSIVAMYYLRCIHPPGGATALLTVIGDQKIHAMGYHFIIMPVLANVAILLIVALLINRLILRRDYPMNFVLSDKESSRQHARPSVKLSFSQEDLASAMKEMNGYIDVTGEDLEKIYSLAIVHSHQRRLGELRLKDIMTREVVTIKPQQSLEEVWKLLRRHRIRGAPVVDEANKLLGIVSIADFLKVADWRMCNTLVARMKLFFSNQGSHTVAQIMSTPVIVGHENMLLTQAFLLFSEKGINHLPLVDESGELVGILTRLDLLSSLYGDMAVISHE
jgi:CBS domain-containing membrane protein